MLGKKMMIGSALVLGVGLGAGAVSSGAATTSAKHAAGKPTGSPGPPKASTIQNSDGSWTTTIKCFGTVTFNADTTTGVISNIVESPSATAKFTAGSPVVEASDTAITLTANDGSGHVLELDLSASSSGVIAKLYPVAPAGGSGPGAGPGGGNGQRPPKPPKVQLSQNSDGSWSAVVPRVATVSFSADTSTGAISGIVVTLAPNNHFTAGSPVVETSDTAINFTDTDGSGHVLELDLSADSSGVKAWAYPVPPANAPAGPPSGPSSGPSRGGARS